MNARAQAKYIRESPYKVRRAQHEQGYTNTNAHAYIHKYRQLANEAVSHTPVCLCCNECSRACMPASLRCAGFFTTNYAVPCCTMWHARRSHQRLRFAHAALQAPSTPQQLPTRHPRPWSCEGQHPTIQATSKRKSQTPFVHVRPACVHTREQRVVGTRANWFSHTEGNTSWENCPPLPKRSDLCALNSSVSIGLRVRPWRTSTWRECTHSMMSDGTTMVIT